MSSGKDLLTALLEEMIAEQGSDLYLAAGVPPSLRIGDRILPMRQAALTHAQLGAITEHLLDDRHKQEFEEKLELNSAFPWKDGSRFRVNFYKQQQQTGLVIRRIQSNVPTLAELKLPPIYGDLVMQKHGLILVVGQSGSGKSTSLAAMIDHRNRQGGGHVVTIEDPIEYIHTPRKCLFTQRDIGIDTHSFHEALKNVLRQRPDVILVGEIRDADVMSQVLSMSESGHLCLATLHSTNATQTVERIADMFPKAQQGQILKTLAGQLKAILAQRLIDDTAGDKMLAVEILLNKGAIPSLIQEFKLNDIREIISRNNAEGMQTFDQHLFQLLTANRITEQVALKESDSPTDLSLKIRQWRQQGGKPQTVDFRQQKNF